MATRRARLVDPLAEPDEAPLAVGSASQSQGAADRQVAPDVVGLHGGEAVELLRAQGLVAAVEAVEGEPPGAVVGQEPAAGELVAAGGVVVLQVAAERQSEQQSAVEPDENAVMAAAAIGVDDTREWFAALAGEPSVDEEGPMEPEPELVELQPGVRATRTRKHRHSRPPLEEQEFPQAPDPEAYLRPMGDGWASEAPQWTPRQRGSSLWTRGVPRRVRRIALFLGCAAAGLLVGGALTSGGTHTQPRTATPSAPSPPVEAPREVARHPRARPRSPRPVVRSPRPRTAPTPPAAATVPPPAQPASVSAATPPPEVERAALEFQSP